LLIRQGEWVTKRLQYQQLFSWQDRVNSFDENAVSLAFPEEASHEMNNVIVFLAKIFFRFHLAG